tara:strand:+ start:443 stop:1114 length:672 start_codon:yes stop_codon:yes gene_type:complete
LPDALEQPYLDVATDGRVQKAPTTSVGPPATEGGVVQSEVVTVPPGVSQDTVGTIPYGGEFMQQPVQAGIPMLGSPMVYNRVADIARTLAGRGGIGGIATGIGVGALGSNLLDNNGRPPTVPQMVRAVTGQPFTRKTQMAYKNLAEMTGLQNAAACLGIPEQLFCQAMIHRFPVRRRGISAAQLRTAKRVNRTIKQMHSELGLKTTTRRAPARRSASTVIQNS